MPFLDAQWAAGCRNGTELWLWRRLQVRGFQGSLRVASEWRTRRRRAEKVTDQQLQKVPSARTITRLMTIARDHLSKADTHGATGWVAGAASYKHELTAHRTDRPAHRRAPGAPRPGWSHHTPGPGCPSRASEHRDLHTGYKPDREHVRDRSASNGPIKGLPLEQHRTGHDLQARTSRRGKLEPSSRSRPVAESYPRCKVQRRN